MNNKIIAAGVVVALCAVALIGVGYAYTATVTSPNNAIASNYIVVDVGGGAKTLFSSSDEIEYKTVTTEDESGNTVVTYTTVYPNDDSKAWKSEQKITVKKSTGISATTVTIKVELARSYLKDDNGTAGDTSDDRDLFNILYKDNGNKSVAKLTPDAGEAKTGTFSYTESIVCWTFSEVSIGTAYALSISYLDGIDFTGTLDKAPKSLTGVPITVTATA